MSAAGSVALVGGRVRTLDEAGTVAEAVLIEDGSVVAVGTSREIAGRAGAGTEVVDLGGRTALPGLIDAHAHLELSALAEQAWVDVRTAPVGTTIQRVAQRAGETQPGDWVVAQGTFGQPLPTRAQLDAAVPVHPVVIRESMHRLVANTAALERSGVDRRFVEPAGMRVQRSADGEPTGVIEEGFDLLAVPWESSSWLADALPRQALESFVRFGVTTVHELPASAEALDAWRSIAAGGRMPCRIVLNPILSPGHQPTVGSVEEFAAVRRSFGGAHPWLTIGALKLFLDGAGEAAWMRPQLAATPAAWGLPPFTYSALRSVLAGCREAEAQVWMHAVGSVAQELALDVLEETNRTHPAADHRSRIEHVGNAICDPAILPRLAPAGAVPVPTASFMHRYREPSADIGPNRSFPFRTMLEMGLQPPGNSDSAGTQPMATTPWHGVAALVLRRTGGGDPVPPADEALTVEQAVLLPTRFAAQATFAERVQGSLEPGKHGDVAVFRDDPLTMASERLTELEADLTIVGGRIVHRGAGAPA